jgi:hypothetical protein
MFSRRFLKSTIKISFTLNWSNKIRFINFPNMRSISWMRYSYKSKYCKSSAYVCWKSLFKSTFNKINKIYKTIRLNMHKFYIKKREKVAISKGSSKKKQIFIIILNYAPFNFHWKLSKSITKNFFSKIGVPEQILIRYIRLWRNKFDNKKGRSLVVKFFHWVLWKLWRTIP